MLLVMTDCDLLTPACINYPGYPPRGNGQ
eukprot:COSAG02_NODE_38442_length_429_cov_0.624242_2_plen_28_part_01